MARPVQVLKGKYLLGAGLVLWAAWLCWNLASVAHLGLFRLFNGPLQTWVLPLHNFATVVLLIGLALSLFFSVLLALAVLQGRPWRKLVVYGLPILAGALCWMSAIMAHPTWLWGDSQQLIHPGFMVLAMGFPVGLVWQGWQTTRGRFQRAVVAGTLGVAGLAVQGLAQWLL